jgi:hypothetical protein
MRHLESHCAAAVCFSCSTLPSRRQAADWLAWTPTTKDPCVECTFSYETRLSWSTGGRSAERRAAWSNAKARWSGFARRPTVIVFPQPDCGDRCLIALRLAHRRTDGVALGWTLALASTAVRTLQSVQAHRARSRLSHCAPNRQGRRLRGPPHVTLGPAHGRRWQTWQLALSRRSRNGDVHAGSGRMLERARRTLQATPMKCNAGKSGLPHS